MKELYINGQRADITANFSITIESNALGDISKIRSNHTSTMRLPRSVANERIFGFAGVPSMDSTMVRKWFSCTYIVDGVAVIQDGKACLLSAAEDYEISVVWGVNAALKDLIEEGLKLWQLPGNPLVDRLRLQTTISPSTKGYDYGWAEYDSGFGGDTVTPAQLPVVAVKWVWKLIMDKYSITVQMPPASVARMAELLLPMVTMKRYVEDETHSQQSYSAMWIWSQSQNAWLYSPTWASNLNGVLTGTCPASPLVPDPTGVAAAAGGCVLHIDRSSLVSNLVDIAAYGTWQGQQLPEPIITDDGSSEVTVEMEQGDVFKIVTRPGYPIADGTQVTVTGWYESDAPLRVGDWYPIVANLPDMTCVDFIKEVCSQLGIFAVNNSSKSLLLTNVETIETNADQGIEVLKVRNVSWRHGTLAQRNIMKYATDDFMLNTFQSFIVVNDETLEPMADMWTSKFVGIYGSSVPLWSTETVDDGNGNLTVKATLNKLSPRIAREIGPSTTSRVGFTTMPWSAIIASYYDGWQRLIRKPLAVEAEVLMRPWELKALQSDRLLWSSYLGVHLLLLSAQGDDGDIVRMKALKLKS